MGRKRKTIFYLAIVFILILSSLFGFIFYYYSHPSKIKPLLEKTISQSIGARCKIEKLSYRFHPLKISAKGILVTPLADADSFHLKIPDLLVHLKLEGAFGHKRLVIKRLKVESFSLRLSKTLKLPKSKKPKGSFLPGHLLGKLLAVILFREVKFGTAQLNRGEIYAQFEDKNVQLNNIQATLNSDHFLEITCRASAKWPSKLTTFLVPSVQISADHAIDFLNKELKGTLKARGASLKSPEGLVKSLKVEASFTYVHRDEVIRLEPLKVHLEGAEIKRLPATDSHNLNLYLESVCSLKILPRKMEASHFELSIGKFFKSSGAMDFEFGKKLRARLTRLEAQIIPEQVVSLLPGSGTWTDTRFGFEGPVNITGGVDGVKNLDQWEWICNLKAFLKQNLFTYKAPQIQAAARIGGKLVVKGKVPDLSFSAKVSADQATMVGKNTHLEPFKMHLSFLGKYPLFTIKTLVLQIPEARFHAGKREVPVKNIRAYLKGGAFDAKQRSLSLPTITINTSLLRNLLVSVDVNKNRTTLALKGKDVRLLGSALDLDLLPAGWSFSAQDDFELNSSLAKRGEWTLTSRVHLKGLNFESQDASTTAEGLSVGIRVHVKGRLRSPFFSASLGMNVDKGEALYDKFYINLASNPFFSSWEGKGNISQESFQFSKISLGLRNILSLSARGAIEGRGENKRIQLIASVPPTRLESLFKPFVQEPYQAEKPFLATLNMEGDISAGFEMDAYKSGLALKGHLLWQNGGVDAPEGSISLKGINLNLPLWYERSNPRRGSTAKTEKQKHLEVAYKSQQEKRKIKGRLEIKSLSLPLLPEQSLELPLSASKNLLRVTSPVILKLPGGELEIGYLIIKNFYPFPPTILTSLSLGKMDLGPLLSRKWSRPIKGFAVGKLDPIKISRGRIETTGTIRTNVFGGEILAYGFGVSGSLVSAPVFHLNAKWKNIQLGEVTEGTSFGKIQGIMNGYVKDLEISFGQPQKFDLLLETVKKRGIPQKISVRAIDNIAQIGGGHSPFIGLAGVMTSFFKELPYEKIGVHATLHNDVFRINGTIKEKGKEYIVKRGGFSGVNVINQNPDNLISFKDMVERMKRVTAPKGGPVVK